MGTHMGRPYSAWQKTRFYETKDERLRALVLNSAHFIIGLGLVVFALAGPQKITPLANSTTPQLEHANPSNIFTILATGRTNP